MPTLEYVMSEYQFYEHVVYHPLAPTARGNLKSTPQFFEHSIHNPNTRWHTNLEAEKSDAEEDRREFRNSLRDSGCIACGKQGWERRMRCNLQLGNPSSEPCG